MVERVKNFRYSSAEMELYDNLVRQFMQLQYHTAFTIEFNKVLMQDDLSQTVAYYNYFKDHDISRCKVFSFID